jgi:precorrin-3B C17-methyltransferase
MTGRLAIVGIGPGSPEQVTPEARAAVENAEAVFGYGPYLDRLDIPAERKNPSDNREELSRAESALTRAAAGQTGRHGLGRRSRRLRHGGGDLRGRRTRPVPLARDRDRDDTRRHRHAGGGSPCGCAARPRFLRHLAVGQSEALGGGRAQAWRRRRAPAFVIALYNPISRARPWQLGRAFELLATILPASTPVIFGRAAGRPDERIETVRLDKAEAEMADMATCVIIGSPETRSSNGRIARRSSTRPAFRPRLQNERSRQQPRPPWRPSHASGLAAGGP